MRFVLILSLLMKVFFYNFVCMGTLLVLVFRKVDNLIFECISFCDFKFDLCEFMRFWLVFFFLVIMLLKEGEIGFYNFFYI